MRLLRILDSRESAAINVLLISTYELGHQPLWVARPAAHLAAAGHTVRCLDLATERLDPVAVAEADLVGISIPMHTATRLGMRLAPRLRDLNPSAHLCFYGLYAGLHADVLRASGRAGERPLADSVIGGEVEEPLVELAERLAAGDRAGAALTFLGRQALLVPRRDLLPPLERYARVDDGERLKLTGYVEASRGCAHRCLHCPITPVYGGRLRIVQEEVVVEEVRQLVAMGAEHVTFGDPDFFNGIRHSLRTLERIHAELPHLTCDVTIKVEHLLEHWRHLARLRDLGCLFIVTAVEAVDDRVLGQLAKGHTRADVVDALALARDVGLTLRPTFVPFTPWTSLEGYRALLAFVAEHDLVESVDPVQYSIRLLVPRGSSLLGTPQMAPYLGDFDRETLSYAWAHPDPRMDALQRRVAAIVEEASRGGEAPATTFARVWAAATGEATPRVTAAAGPPRRRVPQLTEPWFC